jgi:hypothetical protein
MDSELTKIKFDMNDMKNDIKGLGTKLDSTNLKVAEIHADLKEFIEKSESRFAGKWTEKLLIFVGSAVGLALIGALMALVLK